MTDAERVFPVLWGYDIQDRIRELRAAGVAFLPLGVPWDMLRPHERQAKSNHGQTLARLAERGGLSPCEALAVLDDRPWQRMSLAVSCAELCDRVNGRRTKT